VKTVGILVKIKRRFDLYKGYCMTTVCHEEYGSGKMARNLNFEKVFFFGH